MWVSNLQPRDQEGHPLLNEPAGCPKSFTVSNLLFTSMIHFELNFVSSVRKGSSVVLSACRYETAPAPFVENIVLSSFNCLGTLVENDI